MRGQKHLIKCRCVLPQYKTFKDPPAHRFVVFSKINENDEVLPRYSQCNNCGIIHKVTNICTSEIVAGKDHMNSLIHINDIKVSIPKMFSDILESNSADLATWESVQFIIENKQWGHIAILSSEIEGSDVNGKYIKVLSESLCKIESFTRSTGVI